ncbi:hypothetical protein DFS34DRAFT_620801 [Phlyctochytrium arcticum]|nr:hypothetical protein DFS34DRAFT_620801 [Phlyctochytrium arcticum]
MTDDGFSIRDRRHPGPTTPKRKSKTIPLLPVQELAELSQASRLLAVTPTELEAAIVQSTTIPETQTEGNGSSAKRRKTQTPDSPLKSCSCGKTYKTDRGFNNHITKCSVQSAVSTTFAPPSSSELPRKLSPGTSPAPDAILPSNEPLIQSGPSQATSGSSSSGRQRNKSGTPPSPIEFPENFPAELHNLDEKFRCLNTIHCFCTVQRQVVCTLRMLKSSVKQLNGSDFTEQDLAQMCAVAPALIRLFFAYSNELEDGSLQELKENPDTRREIDLVIEFRDARPVQVFGRRKIKSKKDAQEGRNFISLKDLVKPSVSGKRMPTIIQRRQRAFREYLLNFWQETLTNNESYMDKLTSLAAKAIPYSSIVPFASSRESTPKATLPERPSSLQSLVDDIRQDPFYRNQIEEGCLHVEEAYTPQCGRLDEPLSADLKQALKRASSIDELYTHQSDAINHIGNGHHVVVSTATSSGKSLIYQIPVLRGLELDSSLRAIYIFPTKALAQDQKRALHSILSYTEHLQWVTADTYDGDTPLRGNVRDNIRDTASVIFTNPDMLHISILPGHKKWKVWLSKLRYVILDELHYYSGTFGSHCAMIMRRLRRLCHFYGNDNVQFISCSATVANPAEIMSSFFGLPEDSVRAVEVNGAPRGRKLHVIWNPPWKDENVRSQGRVNSVEEAAKLMTYLMIHGVRTICFARYRRACELMLKELQAMLRDVAPQYVDMAMSYRGGYTPEDRRDIERRMFRGDLLCIIATNALELGVDIGSLDAVIHLGFPFNLASYRQQSGRAGRRERDSMSILVAEGDSSVDQFYVKEPMQLFSSTLDASGVELDNEIIVEAHLQCAAYEWPAVISRDCEYFGDADFLENLCEKHLRYDDMHKVWFAGAKYESHPASQISIRSIDDESYQIVDVTTHRTLEELEESRVPFTLYEGSVFIHQGATYLVFQVDHERKVGKVRPASVDYITVQRDFTNADPTKTTETRLVKENEDGITAHNVMAYYGEIQVVTTVFGYFKINPRTKQRMEAVDGLENIPLVKFRHGFWINVPEDTLELLRQRDLNIEFCIHGASHAILSLIPTYVMIPIMGQTDIRTECKHPDASRPRPPRIIIYDSAGGKGGLGRKAYKHIADLVARAAQVVEKCPCEKGCVGCVTALKCTERGGSIDKAGALLLLNGLKAVKPVF